MNIGGRNVGCCQQEARKRGLTVTWTTLSLHNVGLAVRVLEFFGGNFLGPCLISHLLCLQVGCVSPGWEEARFLVCLQANFPFSGPTHACWATVILNL